jgi:hypothetical protein
MNNNTSLAVVSGESGVASATEGGANAVVLRRADSVSSPQAEEGPAAEVDLSYAAVREAEAKMLELPAAQRIAIERLTSGSTAVDAALAAGVGRTTLYRWMKTDAAFIAAHNTWKRDLLGTSEGRALALVDTALTAVGQDMRRGNGKLAMRYLEKMGIIGKPEVGETDVEEVKRRQEVEERAAELARR